MLSPGLESVLFHQEDHRLHQWGPQQARGGHLGQDNLKEVSPKGLSNSVSRVGSDRDSPDAERAGGGRKGYQTLKERPRQAA